MSKLIYLETEAPIRSFVIPDTRATHALWGNLNKYIITAHEDGSLRKWDPAVSAL